MYWTAIGSFFFIKKIKAFAPFKFQLGGFIYFLIIGIETVGLDLNSDPSGIKNLIDFDSFGLDFGIDKKISIPVRSLESCPYLIRTMRSLNQTALAKAT